LVIEIQDLNMKKNGFTKIELLIVIFLMIVMIGVDIAVVLYLNQKSRDIAVLSDIKQIQNGLDDFLLVNSTYPLSTEAVNLNDVYANTEKLCTDGFKKASEKCVRTILASLPNSDLANGNIFKYQSLDGLDYKIEFILKTNFKAQGLTIGKNCATSTQILSQPCF
jgi:type II secretory pathway pseudopilin PulG